MSGKLSHLNEDGEARMVDVSGKAVTVREARASAVVSLSAAALEEMLAGDNKKGNVLAVARVAGIQAAKKCSDLIPLCHPLPLSKVSIDFSIDQQQSQVQVLSYCKLAGQTGVEMEALTAASVAALTIYDMCKAIDKGIVISSLQLLEKTGGKSGDWSRS